MTTPPLPPLPLPPDVDGSAGVWAPLKAMDLDFSQMSTPSHFVHDPRLAWAFWHYRHTAYTQGVPHQGYNLLAEWGSSKPFGLFSVTSNIDGHWQRTQGVGLERLCAPPRPTAPHCFLTIKHAAAAGTRCTAR